MTRPSPAWIEELPKDRLVAEFSVWSADLTRLADEIGRIEPYADILHVDVADGHFAPALLFFPDLVAAIRRLTAKPIHVHLMTADDILLDQISQFVEAGSDLISIHIENRGVAAEALNLLDRSGVAAGMVLKVDTPVADVEPFISRLRFLTLLGTAIGVKGQGLDERAEERLAMAKRLIGKVDPSQRVVLAADGGIREHTVPLLRQWGAETVVLGSLAFGAPSLDARMKWLRAL